MDVTEGRHTLTDPHHGIIDLYWVGNYVSGVLKLFYVRSKYLKPLEEGLRKK